MSKGKQDIPIREELNLLESYLKIQRMRFDDSIEVEYELDESLLDVHVVKLTLQPIVETRFIMAEMTIQKFSIF